MNTSVYSNTLTTTEEFGLCCACTLFALKYFIGAPVPQLPNCLTHIISKAISLHHRFSLVEHCKDSVTKLKQVEKYT